VGNWRRYGFFGAIIGLVIMNGLIMLYLGANIIDWKIGWLNINPPYETKSLPLTIMYPPSPASMTTTYIGPNTIYLELMLNYSNIMAEGQPIEFAGTGTISPAIVPQVRTVDIVFEGALPYGSETAYRPSGTLARYWGIEFTPTLEDVTPIPVYAGASLVGYKTVLEFPVQSDYYPTLVVEFTDRSIKPYEYTFQDAAHRIHIDSADILQQQNFGRVGAACAVSSALFAVIDGSAYVVHLVINRKSKEGDNDGNKNEAKKPESKTSNEGQPYYKLRGGKAKSKKPVKDKGQTN
jgi:hypothetical protein